LLAQQKMAETELNARHGTTLETQLEGVFSDPHADFRWQVSYADSPLPSVKMVTITVLWGDEERNEMVDLTSFIF
jgi:general secretion pathway protein I